MTEIIALAAFVSALLAIGLVGAALMREAIDESAPAPLPVRREGGMPDDPARRSHSGPTAAGPSDTFSIEA